MNPAYRPMLATLVDNPFDDKAWVFETKWDGFRLITEKSGDRLRLWSRNGIDVTQKYAVLLPALQKIEGSCVVDGELCALDAQGRSRFQLLQNALNKKARLLYVVFDALFVPGKDIREKPLLERKEILKALLPSDPLVRYSESVADGLFPSLCVRPNSPSGRVKARCGILPFLGCASTKRRWTSSASKHEVRRNLIPLAACGSRVRRSLALLPKERLLAMTDSDLIRFVNAQASVHDQVIAELTGGRKRTHWMWFIFPQLSGLGHSPMAQRYAIQDLEQAKRYLADPILGSRLRQDVRLMIGHKAKSALEVLGSPDDLKFRSCLTLFARAASNTPDRALFEEALHQFYKGPDLRTMRLLAAMSQS